MTTNQITSRWSTLSKMTFMFMVYPLSKSIILCAVTKQPTAEAKYPSMENTEFVGEKPDVVREIYILFTSLCL
jgi:hypothetical protein